MKLYTIASGSSGNCVCINNAATCFLVDAGITAKRIEAGLNAVGYGLQDLDAVLVTHEHIDHVRGIEVIIKKHAVPIYGTPETLNEVVKNAKNATEMKALFHYINPGDSFLINDVEVNTFSTSHDAGNPIGYTFTSLGHKIGMATDLGCYDEKIIGELAGSDILYLEANYDLNMLMAGGYPYRLKLRIAGEYGHLSNDMSAELVTRLLHEQLRHVVIAHMSKENNYAELAYETIRQAVQQNWRWNKTAPIVTVANRDIPTEPVYTNGGENE